MSVVLAVILVLLALGALFVLGLALGIHGWR